MNFLIPELIRAISYAVIIPSFVILCNRSWRARRWAIWRSWPARLRSTTHGTFRSDPGCQRAEHARATHIATPLTVFVAVTAAALVFQPAIFQKIADRRRRQRGERAREHARAALYFV